MACLHKAIAQVPPTTATTTTTVTPPGASLTSSAPVATPTVPGFINTSGLTITTPFSGMSIGQDRFLSIGGSIQGQKPIASILISVAKKDGSGNTTIVDKKGLATLRISETWQVKADLYPVGEYLLHLVITPNTTVAAPPKTSLAPAAATTALVPPPPPVGGEPSVYFWQGTVRVVAPPTSAPTIPNAGYSLATPGNTITLIKMTMVLGAIVLGCMFAL
ncbi:hypothetical protein BGZ94_007603 [Podila epigama]|nr:hypothetical protein BGZ94_007603 [Podila epigama]